MSKVQDQAPLPGDEQRAWHKENLDRQQMRHEKIVADMEQLAEQRDIWIEQFLQRIQSRGFNYNCDALRKIPEDEVPAKPDRAFKVVF